MFSALVRKEWLQLKSLRWVGLGLGALMPPFLLAAAEAARQGWLPYERISNYSTETVFLEVQPLFLLALGGLLTLLISCQSFSADRAQGTEQFLLERPVERSKIWWARLLAALTTTLLVVAGHVVVWWAFARWAAPADAPAWDAAMRLLGLGGPLTVGVAFLAGLAAASLVSSPMQAVLLGGVLAAVPVGIGGMLAGLFPYASYRGVSLGLLVPLLLLAGYPAGSFYMLCRGEPAGRGRLLRGGVVLALALLATPICFVGTAPLAMRIEAGRWTDGAEIVAPQRGSVAAVYDMRQDSGWLIDLERRQRMRFFAPPIFNLLWNRDGSRLAVVSAAGRFGRFSTETRVDFYDEQGRLLRSISADPQIHFLGDARWAGGYLVVRLHGSSERGDLWIVSPDSGERRSIPVELAARNWGLLGPDDEGNLYVFRARSNDWPASTAVVLQRVDVERAELDPRPLLEEEGLVVGEEQQFYFYATRISPGGRYLQTTMSWWFDLHTGREHRLPSATWTQWLAGDRLAWLEKEGSGTRLLWGAPGGEPELLRRWESGSVTMTASPDRERLLVSVFDLGEDPRFYRFQYGEKLPAEARLREMWIVEPAPGRWIDAGSWVDRSLTFQQQRVGWAAPETLALTGPGFLALRAIDPSAETHYVFGSGVGR